MNKVARSAEEQITTEITMSEILQAAVYPRRERDGFATTTANFSNVDLVRLCTAADVFFETCQVVIRKRF